MLGNSTLYTCLYSRIKRARSGSRQEILMLALCCTFFASYVAAEVLYSGFIPNFFRRICFQCNTVGEKPEDEKTTVGISIVCSTTVPAILGDIDSGVKY